MKQVDLNEVPLPYIVPLCQHFNNEMFYVLGERDHLKEGDVYVSPGTRKVTVTQYPRDPAKWCEDITYYRAASPSPCSDSEQAVMGEIKLPVRKAKEDCWYVIKLGAIRTSDVFPCETQAIANSLAAQLAEAAGQVYHVVNTTSKFEKVPAEVRATVF